MPQKNTITAAKSKELFLSAILERLDSLDAKMSTVVTLNGTEITLRRFARMIGKSPTTVRRLIEEGADQWGVIPKFDKGNGKNGKLTCPIDRYLAWAANERRIKAATR